MTPYSTNAAGVCVGGREEEKAGDEWDGVNTTGQKGFLESQQHNL